MCSSKYGIQTETQRHVSGLGTCADSKEGGSRAYVLHRDGRTTREQMDWGSKTTGKRKDKRADLWQEGTDG